MKNNNSELGFDLYIDPGNASQEQLKKLFSAFSDLNRSYGGKGLAFKDIELCSYYPIHKMQAVPIKNSMDSKKKE